MREMRLRNLPPISALCSVEAVARHRSVTRAANEIGLTQSAVSHNIRLVEEFVGLSLFRRDSGGTVALPQGEALSSAIRDGLARISDTIAGIRRRDVGPTLTISLLPGFAVKWLFPRLIKLDEAYPEIEPSITTSAHLADFDSGEADVALRYGTGSYPGLYVEKLFEEEMFPVCHPRFLGAEAGAKRLTAIADLTQHTLLHDEIWPLRETRTGWRAWLESAGHADLPVGRGRQFTQSNISIQAAIEGFGVAMGRSPLVVDDLRDGRLVCPFGPSVKTGYSYYFVCPRASLQYDTIKAFRDWLMREAEATQALIGRLRP